MKKYIYPFFLAFFLFAISIQTSFATSNMTGGKLVTLASDEEINEDYFAGGDVVEINGTVNGDVYVAGGQVFVNGLINGDLLVAGGDVTISGVITQNVRTVGGSVIVNADIGRNLTVGAGNATITDKARVAGSVVVGAGNVTLSAPVGNNVTVGSGNLILASTVGGKVNAGVETITVASGTKIANDLTYWSYEDAQISNEATILGNTTKNTPSSKSTKKVSKNDFNKSFKKFIQTTKFVGFLSALLVGLLLLNFFPSYGKKTIKTLGQKPWASLGVGFAILFLTPIAIILLFVSIIGAPLGFITLSIFFVYLYLAKIFVMLWVGDKMFPKTNLKVSFMAGAIVFYLIGLIPFVGFPLRFVSMLLGLGSMFLTCKKYLPKKDVI